MALIDPILGPLVRLFFTGIRLIDRRRLGSALAWLMRHLGPWLPEQATGRANLAAAFPDKSPAEIDRILTGVWDNLGRVAAEFAHIDRLRVFDPARPGPADIVYDDDTLRRFERLRDRRGPALFFAAHLANWEIPALVAAARGLNATILYRRPNIKAMNDAILDIRAGSMGRLVATSLDAPVKLARMLAEGERIAMLVDQHLVQGVGVTFFGRPCKANPLIAMLARQIDCPIYGVRVVRLADHHTFRGEITPAIEPARDSTGRVDVAATMQVITSVVERWVRQHPEQWLWLHRRWK